MNHTIFYSIGALYILTSKLFTVEVLGTSFKPVTKVYTKVMPCHANRILFKNIQDSVGASARAN